ncbi:MAG: hypothetical protein RLZZ526_1830 [Actinomycetota bacterium]
MDNDDLDLPGPVADALRNVPPADPTTKDAHIAAALAAWASEVNRPSHVTSIDSRRRILLSTAAAFLLVVGAGIGWVIHSPRATPVAADVSVGTVAPEGSADTAPSSTVTKGDAAVASARTPECANGELQPIDSTYIGEFDAADGRTYLVFQFNGTLEFVDKDTCQWVNLVPGTTTP